MSRLLGTRSGLAVEYGSRENRGDSERVVVDGEEVNGQGQGESCKNTKNAKREPRLGDLNGPFSTLYVDIHTEAIGEVVRRYSCSPGVYMYCELWGSPSTVSLIINVIRWRRWERN